MPLNGRRAQAARNDELILTAARTVFAADPSAPIAAVAEHAGVGISAVYRRCASKEELLRRLCTDAVRLYNAEADAALADGGDGWTVFRRFMGRVVAADLYALTLRLAGTFTPDPELRHEALRAQELSTRLFERTRAAGVIRPDIVLDDIALIFEQVAAIRIADEDRTLRLRERCLALMLDALRSDPAGPSRARRPYGRRSRGAGSGDLHRAHVAWGSRSSRRRITPSRNAHGQTVASVTPRRSMAASATMAPAGSCGARPSDTPGSPARSAAVIAGSRPAHSVTSECVRTRFTSGPWFDGAAPVMRASCRNVLDVATALSGAPYLSTVPTSRAIVGTDVLAQLAYLFRRQRVGAEPVAGEPPGAERHRHGGVGLLVGAGGDLQRAAADVQDEQPPRRPAEPAPGGEEGEPRLVLAGQHRDVDAAGVAYAAEDLVAVDRVADRRRREGDDLLDALVLGDAQGVVDELVQLPRAQVGKPVAVFEMGGEPEIVLVGERRKGRRTLVGVHHEQVNGIGPHIEDTESHT